MSETIWLETSDGRWKAGGKRDNSVLLRMVPTLDVVAARLGVTTLGSFYDNSALAEAVTEEMGDQAPGMAPPEVWFDPADGRRTFAALLEELRDHPENVALPSNLPCRRWPQDLQEELEYCLAQLDEAVAQQQKFHLLIVP
jgi:hypothetical protein